MDPYRNGSVTRTLKTNIGRSPAVVQAGGLSALIVDDDERNLVALGALLKRRGIAVHQASGGAAALEILSERADIDIVLMDIMMPVMDGYETTATIRRRPAWKHLPIIAITAKDADGEGDRCLASGASGYISKPINPSELWTAIDAWLPPAREQRLAGSESDLQPLS